MNKRVKELMLSKGLHTNISADYQARIEMITDAVIEECIKVARISEQAGEGEGWYAWYAIQKHFGLSDK